MLRDLSTEEVPLDDLEATAAWWLTSTRDTVAAKTTARRIVSVRAFSSWAGSGDILGDYIAPKVPVGMAKALPGGLDDVRKMIAVAGRKNHRALVALCGFGGLRVHEAVEIRPSSFNAELKAITVYGKGKKTRYIPITEELMSYVGPALLESYCRGNDDPIVGLKDRVARRLVTALAERAGIGRHVASHDLRATFATAINNATHDLKLTGQMLGHVSLSTTQIYVGTTMKQMRDAMTLISKEPSDV